MQHHYRIFPSAVCLSAFVLATLAAVGGNVDGQTISKESLLGIVVDDSAAQLEGEWKASQHVSPFVGAGYQHDDNADKGKKRATFVAKLPADGKYHVLLAYTTGGSRATNVPVTITSVDGEKMVTVDQRKSASLYHGFEHLGEFSFTKDQGAVVTVSNAGTNGHVIIDAVQVVTPDEFKKIQELTKQMPKVVQKLPKKTTPAKAKPPAEVAVSVEYSKVAPPKELARLSPAALDKLLVSHVSDMSSELIADEVFLRRVTLDICGRQPTISEQEAFHADTSSEKRASAIDRLLAHEDYGKNWANYWSDVIGSRQTEPELTFHNYTPFKGWLATQFNSDRHWDQLVFDMLTATGKVGANPAGTFIAFHQANEKLIAGETSRVFLSVQIACAECHDHPFVDMPQETFHSMAAFFVRTEAKIPQNDSSGIELKSKTSGEHKMPGRKEEMRPVALRSITESGMEYETGTPDVTRRAALAQWIVNPENPYFARAYVNRVWARMMGRGFYEPVDEIGQLAEDPMLPELHQQLADHFTATGYDHKDLVRLIASTKAYQRPLATSPPEESPPLAAAITKKLRGDEVFDSLVTAIALPNFTPPMPKKTSAVRFPVPPKSTRDLVNEAFGYDPSFKDDLLVRTMKQAMFMMSNEQLQQQINAQSDSETYLARLLAENQDDQLATTNLYRAVLARSPTEQELGVVTRHIGKVNDRGAAYEDILWSLLNSAEFTTKR